ncbi:MAG: hypothetical protein WAU31_04835 [Candidatus Moraniibacteriota bacterium]
MTNSLVFSLILFVAVTSVIVLFLLAYLIKKMSDRNINKFYLKIREDIKYAASTKLVEFSVSVGDIIDLAVEIWRMEQRIAKSIAGLSENQGKSLESSIQKLRRYIEKYDIEIVDYKDMKYNEGLNLDILSIEKDPTLQGSKIKEVIEPTILCKGQVVRKAKIVLLSNR